MLTQGVFRSSEQRENKRLELQLIKNAEEVYAPTAFLARPRILIAGGLVAGLLNEDEAIALEAHFPDVEVLDASGCLIVPGFVDMHVHITGGGGEAGPASRCPESKLSELLNAGITTCVGVLGTDSITRSQENLLAKCRALNEEGVTCYYWCGGYRLPVPTITGDVQRELCTIDSCIGVGELAICDHRSSVPTSHEIARLASEARVGGMLSGKCGLLYCHMGSGCELLLPLRDAVANSNVPITQFLPTHMDRTPALVQHGKVWLQDGGNLDFTARGAEVRAALLEYKEDGLPLQNCTVSSDAYGSLPDFDEKGELTRYKVADPGALLRFLKDMVMKEGWEMEQVLPFITSNPARVLKLAGKGVIELGGHGDLLLLDQKTLDVRYAFAKGVCVKTPEWTRGGCFEHGPHIKPFVIKT